MFDFPKTALPTAGGATPATKSNSPTFRFSSTNTDRTSGPATKSNSLAASQFGVNRTSQFATTTTHTFGPATTATVPAPVGGTLGSTTTTAVPIASNVFGGAVTNVAPGGSAQALVNSSQQYSNNHNIELFMQMRQCKEQSNNPSQQNFNNHRNKLDMQLQQRREQSRARGSNNPSLKDDNRKPSAIDNRTNPFSLNSSIRKGCPN